MTPVVTSHPSDHRGITSSVRGEHTQAAMGILRRSRDVQDGAEMRRARSLYSDLVLAEHFSNPQEILDKIRVRPRLASPPPEVTRQSVRRVKRRQQRLRWSDASMARSASSEHLATMRASCSCSCGLEDRRGMSRSVGNLYDLVEERDECHVKSRNNFNSEENITRVKSEDHDYVNCDTMEHMEAYNSLMSILRQQQERSKRSGRRKHKRTTQHLSPGCMLSAYNAEFLLKHYFSTTN